jgi:hypothetical protein
MLRSRFGGGKSIAAQPLTNYPVILKRSPSPWQDPKEISEYEEDKISDNVTLSRAYVHAQMYIISVSLFVLFFFDGSAFSAGSLISAIFWISAGVAQLTRMEAIANEQIDDPVLKGLKGEWNQEAKWK